MSPIPGLALPASAVARERLATGNYREPSSDAAAAAQRDDFITREAAEAQVKMLPKDWPRPVGHRIAILILAPPNKVGDIIIVSDQTAETVASPQGVVLAVGDQADKHWVKPGQRVLIERYAGRVFKLANGQVIAYTNDDDPLAAFPEDLFDVST